MFCGNCGAEVQDGVAFCGVCGAQLANSAAAQPQYEQPQYVQPQYTQPQYQAPQYEAPQYANEPAPAPEKKNSYIIPLIACILAGWILVIGAIVVISGKSYEKVAKKYVTAQMKCDYKKAFKYTVIDMDKVLNDYFEYMEDERDEDIDELYEELEDEYDIKVRNINDVLECASMEAEENMFDQYGEYKVKVKVMRSKKLTARKIKDVVDGDDTVIADYEVDDYIRSDKIKKAYEVKLKVIIDGEEEYEADTITYTVVKYRGRWKVYTLSIPMP